ncbi:MAG: ABC transporter transmembrane domain-containing protein, partial [bacterium]
MAEENKKITKEKVKIVVKTIARLIKNYKKDVITLAFLGIISAIGNGVIPYVTGQFFDSLIRRGQEWSLFGFSLPLFVILLSLWVIIQVATALIDWRKTIKALKVENNIWSDYMSNGVSKMLLFPVSFFKDNNSSTLTHKLDMSASTITRTFLEILLSVAPKILSLLIAFTVCYYISPILLLTLIVGLIIFSIVISYSVKPMAGFQDDFWTKINDAWGDFCGMLDNAQAVKQCNTEQYEKKRLRVMFKEWLMPALFKKDSIKLHVNFYQRVIIIITQFAIFCVSLGLLFKNQITIGDVLAFNAYTALAFGPLLDFGYEWQNIVGGIITVSDTEKTLGIPTENYRPKDFIKMDSIE